MRIQFYRRGNKSSGFLFIHSLEKRPGTFVEDSNVWADSEIRYWLNHELLNSVFTDDKKATILETKLPDVGTTDKVFLLSHEEAKMLFKGNKARRVKSSQWQCVHKNIKHLFARDIKRLIIIRFG